MHRIELVSEIEPMFMISDKIHLTWENPGPIDVDLATYTEKEKTQLRNAIYRNAIKVKNLTPETKVVSTQVSTSGNTSKKSETAKDLLQTVANARQAKIDAATKTLKAPVHSILEFIESTGDFSYVKEMQIQEAQGKARHPVLDALKKKLSGFNNIVSGIIGDSLDEKSIQADKLADAFSIEEEAGEEVEVTLGADE